MDHIVTISLPGLEESVNETIQATNYAKMLSTQSFVKAVVERLNNDERNSMDVLFAYINSLAPELRNWPYDAEDDWLLLDQMNIWAERIRPIIRPLMPSAGIPVYHSHNYDSLTMLIKTPQGYYYAF